MTAARTRAGRSLFLPGGWTELRSPHVPLETWKLPLLGEFGAAGTPLGTVVPAEPPPRSSGAPGSGCWTATRRASSSSRSSAPGVADPPSAGAAAAAPRPRSPEESP
ncbi:hypothetical protein ACFQ0T_42305 [Kitasatospora gansuensis]